MFSFLSRLRLPSSSAQPQDDADDTSSLGRSLNLPWPVTESSARRPATTAATSTPKREWTSNHSLSLSQGSGSGISISYPIPRTIPNSLTGFGEFPMPPSGPVYGEGGSGHGRSVRAGPLQTASAPGAWYEHEKGRSLYPRPQASPQSQAPYAPPEVVRLDSGTLVVTDGSDNENETEGANPPPPRYPYEYTSHPSASSYALPYPYQGMKGTNANPNVQQLSSTKIDSNEYEDDNEAELYTSPFDSDPLDVFPAAPRSTSSTSSTSKTGSGSMTKSRWNLKLQLHSGGAQSSSSPPAGAGALRPNPIHQLPHLADDDQFPRQAYPAALQSGHGPVLEDGQYTLPVSVDTDVYNQAYNYPLAKQLSPIAEQDYVSPAAESDSRSTSLRFGRGGDGSMGKPSPGAESLVGSVFGGGVTRKDREKELEKVGESTERESMKTRTGSVRTGSAGSVGTVNGNGNSVSRAGSMSIGSAPTGGSQNASPGGIVGSELTRPSPIYPSPFVARRLNRTASQTSSKSDSQSQGQSPQPHPQITGSVARPPANMGSPNTNTFGREAVVQTPISAGTSTTPTGTMYTPTSTLQTPVAQTPISPAAGSGVVPIVQSPPMALTAGSFPAQGGHSGLPKIPSLDVMSPLDLRFSLLGSVGPHASSEIKADKKSKAGNTNRKGLGQVERMPVIDGSVEGYYEEEDEEDEDEAEHDDEDENADEEDEDEEYERESLHAESFVTAGTNEDTSADKHNADRHHLDPEIGVELATLGKHSRTGLSSTGSIHSRIRSALASDSGSLRSLPATTLDPGSRGNPITPGSTAGESFIHKRWERDAALGFGATSSSPTTFRAKGQNSRWPFRLFSTSSSSSSFTPAFWAFWLGFIFPVLWLVGGWHFTNAGELPPKCTMWGWYFWNSRWSLEGFRAMMERLFGCGVRRTSVPSDPRKEGVVRGSQDGSVGIDQAQRRKGKRRSNSQLKARSGKVYPALPRWVAEKQSTDDGRMRLNDPKRSLRGISFGYPFISRPPGSQDSSGVLSRSSTVASSTGFIRIMRRAIAIIEKPNRALDLMYGVKLREVRGRPESGRRMFDPWIQRCRYALCYGLTLLTVGLCTASVYLIVVNTRKLT